MKTRFLVSLLSILFLVSCNSDDSDEEFYTFQKNSQIVLSEFGDDTYFANVESGEHLVFMYRFVADEDPDIADDEYSERIIFEIDNALTSFNYSDEELLQTKMYFNQFCFCPNIGSIQIVDGTAEGLKLNNGKWRISLDVSFVVYDDNLQERQIEGVFVLD